MVCIIAETLHLLTRKVSRDKLEVLALVHLHLTLRMLISMCIGYGICIHILSVRDHNNRVTRRMGHFDNIRGQFHNNAFSHLSLFLTSFLSHCLLRSPHADQKSCHSLISTEREVSPQTLQLTDQAQLTSITDLLTSQVSCPVQS